MTSAKYNYQIDMSAVTSHTLILERVRPGTRVLEFGPATGYMTRYLKEQLGCIVYGIEIDPQAAEIAGQYCEKMIVADLDQMEWRAQLEGESFDYILFADVVEHLKNPWQVVEAATSLLTTGGSAIISVPNIGHASILMELLAGRFDYQNTGLLDDTHIRFFTRKSILDLLARVGLSPVELLATTARPEDTEFHQNSSLLPDSLRTALFTKIDAQVYQFVVVANRQQDVKPEQQCTELTILNSQFENGFIRVYWQQDGQLSEVNSLTVPLKEEGEYSVYGFSLPASNSDLIRLDPANYPVYGEIREISLFRAGEAESCIAQWSEQNSFNGVSTADGTLKLQSVNGFKFLATTDDPQIFLPVPLQAKGKALELRISMRLSRSLLETALHELGEQQRNLIDLREKFEGQLAEITRIKSHLEDVKTKLAFREEELHWIRKSRLWELRTRVRQVGRRAYYLLAHLSAPFLGGYRQKLNPVARIRALSNEGQWEAVARDPQFLLRGPWPNGWTKISWIGAAESPLKLRLYLNRGRGFNQVECIELGTLSNHSPRKFQIFAPLGTDIESVRLDPGEEPAEFTLRNFTLTKVTRPGILLRAIKLFFGEKGISADSLRSFYAETHDAFVSGGAKSLWNWAKKVVAQPAENYDLWLKYNSLKEQDFKDIRNAVKKLQYAPKFSIIVPVYNVKEEWLRKCIKSVQAQLYPNWEMCIADDASTDSSVRGILEEYAAADPRIKVVYRQKNGHISAASNSALELASGEFIALLDNDDELTPDALYENALLLNEHPEADMIYSDEDKITEGGQRRDPYFKPGWSPDTILSQMYTCHLGVYRTELVRKIGGFRLGFEGAQDYDLVLRLTENTRNIYHIPKILYHWRTIQESTAGNPEAKRYAFEAGQRAIQEALDRRGERGRVEPVPNQPGQYLVHYDPKDKPLISIIIPTRDMAAILGTCLQSIYDKSTYPNYEVIVVDNGSTEKETFSLFDKWSTKEPDRFKVLRLDIPFNYSTLNNQALTLAKGSLLLLLNNDIEVITPNWLEEMAGQAVRKEVGAVGAKLLYPDNTIQHAGVVVGIGGIAGHAFKGFKSDDLTYFGRLSFVANYAAVTGACLMVKRELFEEVGGLNEDLKVAFNDVDFCLRLVKQGKFNVLLPQVQLYHHESKSRGYDDTPEKMQRFLGEAEYMNEHWQYLLSNDPFYNPNLTLDREDLSLRI